jgi:hypothetical protein
MNENWTKYINELREQETEKVIDMLLAYSRKVGEDFEKNKTTNTLQ